MKRVGVIGTAGRGAQAKKMSKQLFESMVQAVKTTLHSRQLNDVHLVSGGAAWSDHVAVALFLADEVAALTLYLPCAWKQTKSPNGTPSGCYFDSGVSDWRVNPGKTANTYHASFSRAVQHNTLDDISLAETIGAMLDTSSFGFHKRNTKIANCDLLIAFTWSETNQPTDGGTLDTWSKCKTEKVHISLSTLVPKISKSLNISSENNTTDQARKRQRLIAT